MKCNATEGKSEKKKGRTAKRRSSCLSFGQAVLATLRRQFAQYLKQECQANLSRRRTYAVGEVIAGVIGQVTIRMI